MIYTYTMFRKKISWGLALFAAAAFLSCEKDDLSPSYICTNGDCDAAMIFPVLPDANGYYHVELDWSREYLPYFAVDVRASQVIPEFRYNEESVVSANFDSDTSWVIGDSLVMKVPLFRPFTGDWSQSGPLPSGWQDVTLNQFEGIEVNIAQPTTIYFRKVGAAMESRRILGPFIPEMIGDTITVAMRVHWDAGNYSVTKDDYSQKFIVE